MAAPQGRNPRRGPVDESSFTRNLRYEFADVEGRAIVVSYSISVTLGVIWLILVAFFAPTKNSIQLLNPVETAPIEVTTDIPSLPAPTAAEPAGNPVAPSPRPRPGGGGGANRDRSASIASAFGGGSASNTGGMVGDVSNVLRGTEVSSRGTGGLPGTGAKSVLAYGAGGQGSARPGMGGLGQGLGTGKGPGGGLGGVGGGGGVGFAAVRVAPPSVIRADQMSGPGRNVSDLGNYVRSRNSQLQFCYSEYGLKVNPDLAGTVSVAITLTGTGNVTDVDVTRRSWSGPGSSEAESCIRQRIAGWKFPPSDQGGGTYAFSFSFSR